MASGAVEQLMWPASSGVFKVQPTPRQRDHMLEVFSRASLRRWHLPSRPCRCGRSRRLRRNRSRTDVREFINHQFRSALVYQTR